MTTKKQAKKLSKSVPSKSTKSKAKAKARASSDRSVFLGVKLSKAESKQLDAITAKLKVSASAAVREAIARFGIFLKV